MDTKSVLYQLMDTRMEEKMKEITRQDEEYMHSKKMADKYYCELANLHLPKETMQLIDRYVSERNAIGIRYGELAYMLGFSDCVELLLKSGHFVGFQKKETL